MTIKLLNASSSISTGLFFINSDVSASSFTGSITKTNFGNSLFSPSLPLTVASGTTQIFFGNVPSFSMSYFQANSTFSVPFPYAVVQIWIRGGAPGGAGGGGGGSGGSGSTGGGGGGGAGGTSGWSTNWEKIPTYIPSGRSVDITIGTGGAAGFTGSGGTNGQNGSFGGIGGNGNPTTIRDSSTGKTIAFAKGGSRSTNSIQLAGVGGSGSSAGFGAGGAATAAAINGTPTAGPDGGAQFGYTLSAITALAGRPGGTTAGTTGSNSIATSLPGLRQWYGSPTYLLAISASNGGNGSGGTHGGGGAGSHGASSWPGAEVETQFELIPNQINGRGGQGGAGGDANSAGAGVTGSAGTPGISGSNGRAGGGGGGGGGGGAGLTSGGNGGSGGIGGVGSAGAVIFMMQVQ